MHLLVFIADTLSIKTGGWAKQLQQLTTYGTIIRDLYLLATSTCTVYVVRAKSRIYSLACCVFNVSFSASLVPWISTCGPFNHMHMKINGVFHILLYRGNCQYSTLATLLL